MTSEEVLIVAVMEIIDDDGCSHLVEEEGKRSEED